jgi:hypothetical protein
MRGDRPIDGQQGTTTPLMRAAPLTAMRALPSATAAVSRTNSARAHQPALAPSSRLRSNVRPCPQAKREAATTEPAGAAVEPLLVRRRSA